MIKRLLIFMVSFCVCATVAQAADILVPARPGALEQILESGGVRAGDTLRLAEGDHGEIRLRGFRFNQRVIVRPAGGAVTLTGLRLRDIEGMAFVGLNIRSDGSDDGFLVRIRDGSDILLQQLNISSGSGFQRWSKATWLARMRNGIRAQGNRITLRGNRLQGVRHGIAAEGNRITAEGNVVRWFAGDGIRALADNSSYRGNVIDTCVKVDENHDDGIQSWSLDANGRAGRGVVRNVLIEANTIRNGNAGRGLTCGLQGIGFFDGFYENLTIRRNVVLVNHWHGITVMGARNVRIEDNLVLDADPNNDGSPWVTIVPHKDGRPASNSVISGNVTQFVGAANNKKFTQPQTGVRLRDNRIVPSVGAGIQLWNETN